MIKIIITDDQDIVREGLASLLQLREELDVIATARNGQEAFEKAKELEAGYRVNGHPHAGFQRGGGNKINHKLAARRKGFDADNL